MNESLVFLLLGSIVPASGVVIFELRNGTITALTPTNSITLDFDKNGDSDWGIQAGVQTQSPSFYRIRISAFDTTEFLYETRTDEMKLEGLDRGSMIGPGSGSVTLEFASLWLNSNSPDIAESFPLAGLNPKPGNFIGETSYLGFRFEGDEGTHYGYALFTDTAVNRTTLVATAWETEPGKGIIAGAIPEPSTGLLAILAVPILCRRKR